MCTVWMSLIVPATLPVFSGPISFEYLAEWWIVIRFQFPVALVMRRGTASAAFQAERGWIARLRGTAGLAAGAGGGVFGEDFVTRVSVVPRSVSISSRPCSARILCAGFRPVFARTSRKP